MNCIEGTKEIIRQIIGLLHHLDREAFSRPLEVFSGATLGQHFRHILDFYLCLFRDLPSGVIDYAARERNPALEQDPEQAREIFEYIACAVQEVREEAPLVVQADFSSTKAGERPKLSSSAGRELMFAHDHAVHHLAIIRMGLQVNFPSLPVDENLGVASSTIKFRAVKPTPDHS
jgi:uncharacterized damage-inducible protein DinB